MTYLTQERLMLESERAVENCARDGEPAQRRVCAQLLAEPSRYSFWHLRHEERMSAIAGARVRARQILALRAFALEQIHRAALVRYLHDYQVTGKAREQTLRSFRGVVDIREATIAEHRDYRFASANQVCATQLLELARDDNGHDLLRDYEHAYAQFFSLFCECARAQQNREPNLAECLLPEVRIVATRLRQRILDGAPSALTSSVTKSARTPLAIQSTSLVRLPRNGPSAPNRTPR